MLSSNDRKLISKGLDFTDVNTLIKHLKKYIKFPEFGEKNERFDENQILLIHSCTKETVEEAEKRIELVIESLNMQGIDDISVDGWKRYLIEAVPAEKEKLYKAQILPVTNFMNNARMFHEVQPFFYEGKQYLFWDKKERYWKKTTREELMNMLEEYLTLSGETVTNSIKSSYEEAFRRVGVKNKPKDPPIEWLQFKNTIYDIKTSIRFVATPEYYFINPIPWDLGNSPETPILDELFSEWVNETDIITLYEWLAYCCYRAYPIHIMLTLISGGGSGKGQYCNILTHFVGKYNCTSSELHRLMERPHETFKLYKKLVCTMTETNDRVLSDTAEFKKLCGGDLISFEDKYVSSIDAFNYAKLTCSTNSLPPTRDTTDGFFRRQLIVHFPNQFTYGGEVWKKVPEEEYQNLALKVCKMLPTLLKDGFTNEGTISERKLAYQKASNPLPWFIEEMCIRSDEDECIVSTTELFNAYKAYRKEKKLKPMKRAMFLEALEEQGCYQNRCSSKKDSMGREVKGNYIQGLELKKEGWEKQFQIQNMKNM